jgi:acyl carrier protein
MLDKRLVDSLSRAFKIDAAAITPETSQSNTPTWDSFAHLRLVFEIEDAFDVRLSSEEIPQVTSVARLRRFLSVTRPFRHFGLTGALEMLAKHDSMTPAMPLASAVCLIPASLPTATWSKA